MANRRSRGLRKKLRLWEFKELGFAVGRQSRGTADASYYELRDAASPHLRPYSAA
jgi:uncharacterized protein YggL (DUF469 family)